MVSRRSDAKPMRVGFFGHRGRVASLLASWFVPSIMALAYLVLGLTSQSDASGWAWMSIGFGFVLCLWWMFRALGHRAALSRAIAVGDATRVAELGGASPLYRAVAHSLRAEWLLTLSELSKVTSHKPRERVLAATIEVGALVETGEVAKARAVVDRELATTGPLGQLHPRLEAPSHIAVQLARGRVLTAERNYADALPLLHNIIHDIRTAPATRALAHHYAARAAAGAGEFAAADHHRARVTALAPESWFAQP